MTLAFIIVAAIGIVALAERSVTHLPFAVAALSFSVALMLLVVTDLDRAVLLAGILAAVVTIASIIKYHHSALKLSVNDLPLLFAGTAPFLIVQYPRAAIVALAGSIAAILAATAALLYGGGSPIPLDVRMVLFGLTLIFMATTYRMSGGAMPFRRIMAQQRCFYSTFTASLIDLSSWRQFGTLALSDIADDPLPLMPAVPARGVGKPDIIVIQHESVFDPRIFGLPIEPTVEGFLSPTHGRHGSLNVDIFGGGSWQSEFSLLTGLSSASFGSSAYYLFRQGAGRFHNSLPQSLAALGYRTMLASSCRRNFLSYDEFYRSIGIDQRLFADDFPPPFDLRRFEKTGSDALFLEAAFSAYAKGIADDPGPRFLYALTNFNHGPHDRRLATPGQCERERMFAASTLRDDSYIEYYARLAETALTWEKLKADLAMRFPERKMLIVHYGDHQPVMARRIERRLNLASDPRRAFRTFYAIEPVNMAANRFVADPDPVLDIAFLGTVALQQAGLPLDPVFATRASLIDQCRESYFASPSERKRCFHRTLVDMGIIDLEPHAHRNRGVPAPAR